MGNNGPIEPSAVLRIMAKCLREVYLALTQEGFNERQALAIIGSIMTWAIDANPSEKDS